MSRDDLPRKTGPAVRVVVEFGDAELARLDAWIADRGGADRPDREQAIRLILRDALSRAERGAAGR